MAWLYIILFIIGSMFSLAGYGSEDRHQKRNYWLIAVVIWILLFVLINATC